MLLHLQQGHGVEEIHMHRASQNRARSCYIVTKLYTDILVEVLHKSVMPFPADQAKCVSAMRALLPIRDNMRATNAA